MSDTASPSRLDNFDRHTWQTFGAVLGITLTALFGWPVALGWFIAYGLGGLVFYALVTGRLRMVRRG